MKYRATRQFYGDEGMVSHGQIIDIDAKRAEALGALVEPVEETKAEPAPENKMEPAPANKAARRPKVIKEEPAP